MHPIITKIRHTLIKGVLGASDILYTVTKGKRPHFIFADRRKIKDINTDVRIIEKTQTSVTIAKFTPDGTIDDGDFRILTGTDLHLGAPGYDKNRKSIDFMIKHIENEKPDLVIFTGDVILSDCQQIDAVQFARIMEKLGVYWCYVFGNHEAREEKEYFKYLLYKGLSLYPHCLNLFGDPSLYGYGNFCVNILDGENSLRKTLFLFDSGRNIQGCVKKELSLPDDIKGYDFIKPTQIEWYNREIELLKKKYGEVKSILYMHIPVPEYKNVFEGDEENGYTPSGKCEILYGGQYESIGCSPYNSGLFDAGKQNGTLQAIFAGHDHVNDFCAVYNGVYLVYTQCTGYNTYSMEDRFGWKEEDCPYGMTETVLKSDGTIVIRQTKNTEKVSKEQGARSSK